MEKMRPVPGRAVAWIMQTVVRQKQAPRATHTAIAVIVGGNFNLTPFVMIIPTSHRVFTTTKQGPKP